MSSQPVPSSRARGSVRAPGNGRPDARWVAGVIVAAEIGGLAAAALWHESIPAALLIPVAVAAIAAVVVRAQAPGAPRPVRRPERNPADGQPAVPGAAGAGGGRRAGTPSGGRPEGPQGTPERPAAAGNSQPYAWSWTPSADGADGAPAPGPGPADTAPEPVRPGVVTVLQDPGGRSRPPRPANLARFLGQVVIAQCPNCAAFHVAAEWQQQDWRFACRDCGCQWHWRPGTPWPQVHVRPGARRQGRCQA